MDDAVMLVFCALGALFLVSHLRAVLHALVMLWGYAFVIGMAWLALSALWKWLGTLPAGKARRESPRTATPPAGTRAGAPETAVDGRGELILVGPELGKLALRLDPLTRTPFAPGEQAVRCGACGRLYRIDSCRALQYVCPLDRTSLRVRGG